MKKIALMILVAFVACFAAEAKKMSDLTVVVDPGHGGYDGDDRPIHIYPYEYNSQDGYWESKSNLVKGLHMKAILDSLGVKGHLTRVHNVYNEIDGDGIDDEPSLSARAQMANNLSADAFISIHSNAGEGVNYPLMIYHEQDVAGNPRSQESVKFTNVVNDVFNTNIFSNWINYKGEINTATPGRVTGDRSLLGYSLGVLRNCYVTSMLSEGGMHEHRPQAHRLMNDDYNWLEAWHFVQALMQYFNTEDRFVTGNVAGVVYDNHNLRQKEYSSLFWGYTSKGRDVYLPLNGTYVELLDKNGNVVQHRTTDNDYNGVFVFRNITPGEYTVRATKEGFYVRETKVTVVADKVTYEDMPLSLKREFPLEVVSYQPAPAEGELVSCGAKIQLTFNTDINEKAFEKAFKIEPAVEGYFEYSNSYSTVTFWPTVSFEKDTKYTVTVGAATCTPDTIYANNSLGKDFVFEFTTQDRARLSVIDSYPADGGSVHKTAPRLEFRYDYKVDNATYFDHVKVYDAAGKELTVQKRNCKVNQLTNNYGNVVIALADNLVEGESYRAVLSGELRDLTNIPLVDNVTINFVAKDESVAKGDTVVEPFDVASLFAYDAEKSKGVPATTPRYTRSTANKLFGTAGGTFSYTFESNREGDIIWKYNGDVKQFYKGDLVGLYVNGDFNNHELYVGFVGNGADIKYEKVCDLTFLGWEYHEVELASLEAGVPYNLCEIRLVQVTSPITQKGSFSLDNMVRTVNTGIEGVAAAKDVEIVLADDVISVAAASEIKSVELINIQGVKVATAGAANTIDVSELPQGVYVVKVETAKGKTTKRVAVSH